ncbi:putative Phosphinothricin N-acetyltransferase [metagenome]|uniref:Putative Phosphinothricin N-acetyltransferase n=1 Tax=metagenome TaxID=256318 RepID=A0A2P2C163_9ZZZZ
MLVRAAGEEDLAAIAAIYDREVALSVSTFDLEPRPLAYWETRLSSTEPGDHLLVATEGDQVLGYAYSSSYRPRPGYRHTRETSIYLHHGSRGQGIGRQLYPALLSEVRAAGVRSVLAVVALPNDASERLHLACGFERLGVMKEVGRKFDRWIDTAWYQLR